MERYLVIIEKSRTGYSAYSPDLPGCVAAAKSRSGVRKLMREAIDLHIAGLRENGEPVPLPSCESTYIPATG